MHTSVLRDYGYLQGAEAIEQRLSSIALLSHQKPPRFTWHRARGKDCRTVRVLSIHFGQGKIASKPLSTHEVNRYSNLARDVQTDHCLYNALMNVIPQDAAR